MSRWTLLIALCPASLASGDTFRYHYGLSDNFAPPTDPASPSSGVMSFFDNVGPPFAPYDDTTIDRHFVETMGPTFPVCIQTAQLSGVFKPLDISNPTRAASDTIEFLFVDDTGAQIGPRWASHIGNQSVDASLLTLDWGTDNYPFGLGFIFEMDDLPLGTNNTNNSVSDLIPSMELYGYLDVRVQDDTSVDFLSLVITSPLTGDLNGDGIVNGQDTTLVDLFLNQPTPDGIGDPNGDGFIDFQDQVLVDEHLGDRCVPVPEPTTWLLTAIGMIGVSALGRRNSSLLLARFAASAIGAPAPERASVQIRSPLTLAFGATRLDLLCVKRLSCRGRPTSAILINAH